MTNNKLLAITVISSLILLIAWFLCDLGVDPDLFHRLATGRLIDSLGYIPLNDPFAFTPKKPLWIDHEWLSGFIFYKTWLNFGEAGIFNLKILLVLLSLFALCKALINQNSNNPYKALWFILLVIASSFVWRSTLRSQVFTYLFIPCVLLSFTEYQKHKRSFLLYLMPIIMCIWANAHGGFVVGLGFLGIFAFTELLKQKLNSWPILLVFLASIATTFINPYPGITYWEYIIEAIGMPRPFVPEWDPLNPLSHSAIIPNLVAIILIGSFIKHRTNRDLLSPLLLIASAYFGYKHQRLSPILLMTAIVYGAEAFKNFVNKFLSFFPQGKLDGYLAAGKFVFKALVVSTGAWIIFNLASKDRFTLDYSAYPVSSIKWLKENVNIESNLLVTFNHGSYALWELYPKLKVSVDGRYEEVYPESTMHLVMDAYWGEKRKQAEALKIISPDYIITDTSEKDNFAGFAPVFSDQYDTILKSNS